MKKTFQIIAGYQWEIDCPENGKRTNTFTKKALRKIVETLENHVTQKKIDVNLDYVRLRGGAGRNQLSSITNRINESNVAIFDISLHDPNVFLELGIAIARAERDPDYSVYLIRNTSNNFCGEILDEGKEEYNTLSIPSDLWNCRFSLSLFKYDEKKDDIVFQDNSSLYLSILRDINNYMIK